MFIKPAHLSLGDTIGLVSPSSPVAGMVPHRFDLGVKKLEDLGYRVKIADHAREVSGYTAGSARSRAEDLHTMFLDPEVKAIMCCIGGFHANQVLQYLDFDLIRNHPKIFIGFSDISVLHFALHTKANLVTFYGPALMTQFAEPFGIHSYTLNSFTRVLGQATPFGVVHPSTEWTDELLNWFQKADLERPRTMKPNPGYAWIKGGEAEGELIGGCITSILHLRGTEYWPMFEKKLFFWELPESSSDMAKGEPPSRIDAHLTDLELSGVFQKISGMIVGRPKGYTDAQTEELKTVIASYADRYSWPVLFGIDIGHTDPIMTLPLGIRARIDGEKGLFELGEDAVQ